MGRSSGYRPKREVREQVEALRAELAECQHGDWIRAQALQGQCAELMQVKGPSGNAIEPRMCRRCERYGHSAEHCKEPTPEAKRAAWQQSLMRELERDPAAYYDTHMVPYVRRNGAVLKISYADQQAGAVPEGKWAWKAEYHLRRTSSASG